MPFRFSAPTFFLAATLLVAAAPTVRAADQNCPDPAPSPPPSGVCSVTAGDAGRLLRGTVLLPDGVATHGSVMIDAGGMITCAGCGCQNATGADTATRIDCANGVISPGLIDLRNHITFSQDAPAVDTGERYEHRHDWRIGGASHGNHTKIPSVGGASNDQIRWAELRALMAGSTSLLSSGGVAAFTRNLATSVNRDGLAGAAAKFQTFPLGDSGGTTATSGCGTYSFDTAPLSGHYEFVAAEGINAAARNEFLCLAGLQAGGVDLLAGATIAAAIPLRASDAKAIADQAASVVWEPRSDLRLYGMTAPVTLLDAEGVTIALGGNWTVTGSFQVQRELACADSYNATYLNRHFSDAALWRMATANAAVSAGFGGEIGTLAPGRFADIAVFDASARTAHRAVVGAGAGDVVLVVKGGVPMFGEADVVAGLGGGDGVCDTLDVCGNARRLCVTRETGGQTLAQLQSINASNYPLFSCGEPVDEPTCKPVRSQAASLVNVAPFFSGDAVAGDADGDGVPDASDVCRAVFDPPRPADGLVQADEDNDGIGDACDPCPLDAGNACDVLFGNGFEAGGG